MQTAGKTHKSGCRLRIDVGENRDPARTLNRLGVTVTHECDGQTDRLVDYRNYVQCYFNYLFIFRVPTVV